MIGRPSTTCVHIITSEYPPDIGGVSDYTRLVAESLATAGDDVHVWCPEASPRTSDSNVHIHPNAGRFSPSDLRRLTSLLSPFPAPRRLLVQWVPHGFGYHSMNLWLCLWLAGRAMTGDRVELMVHEPFIEFRGALRHLVMALVHRVMTVVLMATADRVWVAIPAWESKLRLYALGRRVRIEWLPIPGCFVSSPGSEGDCIRNAYAAKEQPLVGHFGSYGNSVSSLLEERLGPIMDSRPWPALLLIGAGSETFQGRLVAAHPTWVGRVHATGYIGPQQLRGCLEACDVLVQPYPDGISSRRTSAMAGLSLGRPVVTTSGHLTEGLWGETGAVMLTDVVDPEGFASAVNQLLADDERRHTLGAHGRQVYEEHFSVGRTVNALRAA